MKKKYNIKKEFNLGNNKNNFFVWALLIIVIVSIMQISVGDPSQKLTLSQFDSKLNTGSIEKITCTGHENSNCYGTLSDGGSFSVILLRHLMVEDLFFKVSRSISPFLNSSILSSVE